MKTRVVFCMLAVVLVLPTAAIHATVLTFDDLPDLGTAEVASIGSYGGLLWNMNYADPAKRYTSTGDIGWLNGVVSDPYVAYNTGTGPSQVQVAAGTFDFNDAYFTSLGVSPIRMNLRGFEGGSLKYNLTIEVNNLGPTLIDAGFVGIDRLELTGQIGPTSEPIDYIMDNFRINEPVAVPEPAAMGLFCAGLLATVALGRKKVSKKKAS